MASIAIVGGAGFIGRRLADALRSEGHSVIVVDVVAPAGDEAAYRQADVGDRDDLRTALAGAEVVYNLAAEHRDDVRPVNRYHEVNVGGANNVCEACRELGIERIIFTSSAAVYGTAQRDADEEQATAPISAYGRTKLLAEEVHRAWQAEVPRRRSLVIVRPTVVFGEGNRGNVYQLLRQIASRRFVMVGRGHNRKSMAYVGNVCVFLAHVLRLGNGFHLFNYSDKPDFSMEELVDAVMQTLGRRGLPGIRIPYAAGYLGGMFCDLVAAITGRRLPISAIRVRKFCSTTTFSTVRLRRTGFKPITVLHEALIDTINHEICCSQELSKFL